MKKLYSLSLLLVMLLGVSFTAAADEYTAYLEWSTPGAVAQIWRGSVGYGDIVFDGSQNPTATSFTYTSSSADYFYAVPAEGYIGAGGTCVDDPTKTISASSYYGYLGYYIGSSVNGYTWKLDFAKMNRDKEFTFNVINGASFVTVYFDSYGLSKYPIDIHQGINTIKYDPTYEYNFTIKSTLDEYMTFETLTYNGNPIEVNQWWGYGSVANVEPGSTIVMQKFADGEEPEVKDCNIKFEYPEGMGDAILSIYDKSSGNMTTISNLDNNTLTVKERSTVYVNLNSADYENFSATFNGKAISYSGDRYTIEVTEEVNTFVLNCSEKYYAPVSFSAYIMNPDGVALHLDTENGELAQLTNGTATTSNSSFTVANLEGVNTTYTFEAGKTQIFNLNAPGKHPMVWLSAKPGYYIEAFIAKDSEGEYTMMGGGVHLGYVTSTDIYIMAKPVGDKAKMAVKLNGAQPDVFALMGNELTSSWGNPKPDLTLTSAEQTIEFVVGLDNPFTLRSANSDYPLTGVYLDGLAVPENVTDDGEPNGRFTINAYVPTSADDTAYSTLVAYAGTASASMTGVNFSLLDGAEATLYRSTARIEASTGDNAVVTGTEFAVVPTDPKAVITYKGKVVNGYDEANKTMVEGLNDKGEYVFNVTGNPSSNILTVGPAVEAPTYKPFEIGGVEPEDGAKVRSLNEFKLTIPAPTLDNGEYWIDANIDALSAIAVKQGETVVSTVDENNLDMWGNEDGSELYLTFGLSERITTDGTYTLYVPQGLFRESYFDNAAGSVMPVNGGYATEEFTAEYTVDSSLPTVFTEYTLSPADGSKVGELEAVTVIFPSLSNMDMILANNDDSTPKPTITNGTDTYECLVGYDWEILSGRGILLEVLDPANGRTTISLGKGEWTLTIPANTFTYKGDGNEEITATYTAAGKVELLGIDPADGVEVRSIEEFKVTLPNVDETRETMLYPNAALVKDITITDKEGNAADVTVEPGEGGEDMDGNMTMSFTLTPALTEAGEYTITLPANLFEQAAWDDTAADGDGAFVAVTNGFKTAEFTAEWTVNPEAPTAFTNYTLDPEDGSTVQACSSVTLTFNDIAVPAPMLLGEGQITLTGGDTVLLGVIEEVEDTEVLTYTITFVTNINAEVEKITDGTWTLEIPEGFFNLNNEAVNDAITSTFTVDGNSGIAGIVADPNGNYTVVGIDGRVILRSSNAAALKTLDKGIYIINGRKVAVKK